MVTIFRKPSVNQSIRYVRTRKKLLCKFLIQIFFGNTKRKPRPYLKNEI